MSDARQNGIDAVIDLLTRLATGDLEARGERRQDDEHLDAIIFGINMLAEELTVDRATLEQRVQVRTTELEVARKAATDASRVKSEFLAAMSHEIRTPMNGVIGLTRLLAGTELVGVQRHYVDGLQRAAEVLLAIITDILDVSKLEADKVVLELVDFHPRLMLEKTASLVGMSATNKQLELIAHCGSEVPALLNGDDMRLGQILLNLTANAVKFTEKGEVVVTAHVSAEDEAGVRVRFEVTDTGIGIGSEAQQRLFASFTQADTSTTRRFGGSGLGLAISRGLCELMGGTIGVDSEEGAGSTFWFEVPLGVPASGEPQLASHEVVRDRRILVLDDNRSSQLYLKALLSEWGMRPEVAARPGDVLPLLREAARSGDPFQVALIDTELSDIEAWPLAESIAAAESLVDTCVVMLSRTVALDPTRLAIPGLREILCKPILGSELLGLLESLLTAGSAEGDHPDSALEAPMAQGRGRVLVVEDNEVNQMVAEGMVERLGYEVDVVGNGVEALQAVAGHDYVAILMDCLMPVMDGYTATAEIRRLETAGDRIPIIAMTAGVTVEERERCEAAGMDGFVAKPVDPDVLSDTLIQWARAEREQPPESE